MITGLDATNLHTRFQATFDRIVWNFPQHPERTKIQKQRLLLREFMGSAVRCLVPQGEIWVTLKGGQGGSAAEQIGFERSLKCSWQIQESAAENGLLMFSALPADIEELVAVGYRRYVVRRFVSCGLFFSFP